MYDVTVAKEEKVPLEGLVEVAVEAGGVMAGLEVKVERQTFL